MDTLVGVNTLIAVINEKESWRERTVELWGQDWVPVVGRQPVCIENKTLRCMITGVMVHMEPSYEVDMSRLSTEQVERLTSYVGYWPDHIYLEASRWTLVDSWPIDGQEDE